MGFISLFRKLFQTNLDPKFRVLGKLMILKNSILLFFIGGMILAVLFSGCINWGHVVEHNQLRTIEENDLD
jgi:hypothetical protein